MFDGAFLDGAFPWSELWRRLFVLHSLKLTFSHPKMDADPASSLEELFSGAMLLSRRVILWGDNDLVKS